MSVTFTTRAGMVFQRSMSLQTTSRRWPNTNRLSGVTPMGWSSPHSRIDVARVSRSPKLLRNRIPTRTALTDRSISPSVARMAKLRNATDVFREDSGFRVVTRFLACCGRCVADIGVLC